MPDYILHHYDGSPFAHKARLVLGFKGLAWRSVIIPMIMPKPLLMPLTGGYRRTPVMQIGADVYCDTHLIALELERRHPSPTLFPAGGEGMAAMLTHWADANLFFPAVNFVMSQIADKMPREFFDDRAKMLGRPPTDIEKLKSAGLVLRAQMNRQIDRIVSVLADGRSFLLGDKPGLADFAVCHPLWMATQSGRRAAAALEPYPTIRAWLDRIGAIGTGRRSEMDAREALAVAKSAPRASYDPSTDSDDAPKLGARVKIQSDDRVPEPVTGEVVLVRANEIAVKRSDPEAGDVVVHFPRLGFSVRPA